MKLSGSLAVLAAAGAQAHCKSPPQSYRQPPLTPSPPPTDTFAGTLYNGQRTADWEAVRTTENRFHNGPITDVRSEAMTCYELNPGRGAPRTLGVTAGSTVSITTGGGTSIFHPGPTHFYLAKVPAGQTAATFSGKGAVWFKIAQDQPRGLGTGSLSWESEGMSTPPAPPRASYRYGMRLTIYGSQANLKSRCASPSASRTASTSSASSTLRCTARRRPTARSCTSRARSSTSRAAAGASRPATSCRSPARIARLIRAFCLTRTTLSLRDISTLGRRWRRARGEFGEAEGIKEVYSMYIVA